MISAHHMKCPNYPKYCECRTCVCGMPEHTVIHDVSFQASHNFREVRSSSTPDFRPHFKRGSRCRVVLGPKPRFGTVLHHYFSNRHNVGYVNVVLDELKWPHTYSEEFVEAADAPATVNL